MEKPNFEILEDLIVGLEQMKKEGLLTFFLLQEKKNVSILKEFLGIQTAALELTVEVYQSHEERIIKMLGINPGSTFPDILDAIEEIREEAFKYEGLCK